VLSTSIEVRETKKLNFVDQCYQSTCVMSHNTVTYMEKAFKNLKTQCIKFVSILMLADPVVYYW